MLQQQYGKGFNHPRISYVDKTNGGAQLQWQHLSQLISSIDGSIYPPLSFTGDGNQSSSWKNIRFNLI